MFPEVSVPGAVRLFAGAAISLIYSTIRICPINRPCGVIYGF
ncbi:hypothetical protein [Escherichia Stx1-converting recombinant phage HUN/2013]|nr:hypothetical protein [Escherichia Stx1-converting recombinant phage HUN/2013]